MVRAGEWKYVYIHGYDKQLFDLQNDPGEWNNLIGEKEYADVADHLHSLILDRFDPGAIDQDVRRSVARRWLLKEAMEKTGVSWDVEPRFDPTKPVTEQYLPGKQPPYT
jgi:choline-sulfatase